MIRAEGTSALIALEDASPDVLFEVLPGTGTMIWPLLRWPLAATAAQDELGQVPIRRRIGRAEELRRLADGVLPGPSASARVPRDRDVLFIAGGGTTRATPGGRENWLLAAYTAALGDRAVVVQDRPMPRHPTGAARPAFPATHTFEDALARVDLRTRFAGLPDSQAAHARTVIRETFRQFPYPVADAEVAKVEKTVLYRLARLRHTDAEWRRLIDRVDPRLVVMDLAAYGPRSTMIAMLKDRGVPVVEPQHGWIGPSHAAYNYGAAARTPELAKRLPDVLLTFGEFWSGQVAFPGRMVAVGKPHLEAESAAPPAAPAREVLVASSVVDPDRLADVVLTIRDALPADWSVAMRPHPSERPTLEQRYPSLVGADRVRFDVQGDLYESLRATGAVFGVASTVLYEALAFGVPVVVIDSPLAPYYVEQSLFGDRVDDAPSIRRAVARVVKAGGARKPAAQLDAVWHPDAAAAVERFLAETVPAAPRT